MKISLIVLLLSFIACQDYNSNTFDKARYGKIALVGGPRFDAAYRVIQSRCTNCHAHSSWSGYLDQQQWVDAGLVVPNSSDNSSLIYRIINHGGASSDMPQGGAALPSSEYNALLNWVDQFGQP